MIENNYDKPQYRIMLDKYNRYFDEVTEELYSGGIENNMRNLYENYFPRLTRDWIRYYLLDPEDNVLEERIR